MEDPDLLLCDSVNTIFSCLQHSTSYSVVLNVKAGAKMMRKTLISLTFGRDTFVLLISPTATSDLSPQEQLPAVLAPSFQCNGPAAYFYVC